MPLNEDRFDKGLQLRELLRALRESKWLILGCFVATVAAAVVYTSAQEKEYAATARLLSRDDELSASALGDTGPSEDPDVRAATDLELASLPVVAERVVQELRLPYSGDTLLASVTARSKANSRLITITADDPDPKRAARIANSFASQYVAFRQRRERRRFTRGILTIRRQIRSARRLVGTDAGDARLRRLQAQLGELELLANLQGGDVEVVQRAKTPSSPVTPRPVRNYALGAVAGLLLGFGLGSLRDRLDKRIKREEQLRALVPDVPILASVPLGLERRNQPILAEAFRNLQTNLTFLDVDGGMRSLLVTSAADGEGKSTTSLNLALAIAERDQSALLVDADLRRPALSEILGLRGGQGLSSLLSGQADTIDACLVQVKVGAARSDGNGPAPALSGVVSVLPAGPTPPNPQALLGAESLHPLLGEARSRAERIVIDGPPLGPVSDMLPIAKLVDGVVIVVRLNQSRRDQLELLLERLSQANIEPIGIVLFAVNVKQGEKYYTRQV